MSTELSSPRSPACPSWRDITSCSVRPALLQHRCYRSLLIVLPSARLPNRAYDTTRMYREWKIRSAITKDMALNLLCGGFVWSVDRLSPFLVRYSPIAVAVLVVWSLPGVRHSVVRGRAARCYPVASVPIICRILGPRAKQYNRVNFIVQPMCRRG